MQNMGKVDRVIRVSIAGILIFLFLIKEITGALGIIGLAISGLMLLTSLINFCPLYNAFGWNTKQKKN